jgi:hypothetical protein
MIAEDTLDRMDYLPDEPSRAPGSSQPGHGDSRL